ncbi:MAG: Mth938-like domain-containing protein [Woeseiaceae bacterium]
MKFSREMTTTLMIQRVTKSAITVNGKPYAQTIALTPDEVLANWAPKPIADLVEADFESLLAKAPEILLLGTGPTNVFPPRELLFAFARRGIGLESMDTAAAARTFNVLSGEARQVAAVLYL